MEIYVLQVITGKENEARKTLESLLSEQSNSDHPSFRGRIIHPRRELIQRKGGRRYKKIQPLFPGYLFWETANLSEELIHKATRLPYIIHFLPETKRILPLSPDDANRLKPFLRDTGLTALIKVNFNENDRIIVLEGPLKGQEGSIVKVDRRRRRMRVRLNMYETGHLIDFGYQDIGSANQGKIG